MKAGSAIGNVFGDDSTAMSFYDGAHNGQSHSQPLLLGGKKLIKQVFVHFSANASA